MHAVRTSLALLLAAGAVTVAAQPAGPAAPPLVVSGETGWNALAGTGAQASWRPSAHPWLALDLGAGISLMGPKAGVRARWLGEGAGTVPTLGIGVQAATGTGYDVAEAPAVGPPPALFFGMGGKTLHASVGPTAYVQLVGGAQVRRGSFDATFLVGWSGVAAGHDVRTDAPPNPDQQDWLDLVTGGGIVVSASFGFGG